MEQVALTVITKIRAGHQKRLASALERLRAAQNGPFTRVSTVHFARWMIVGESMEAGRRFPALLVFATDFDASRSAGAVESHLRELAEKMTEELQEIYAHCEEYPAAPTPESIVEYLTRHSHRAPPTYFRGAIGRTVDQIQREDELCNEIRACLHPEGEVAQLMRKLATGNPSDEADSAARRAAWHKIREIVGGNPRFNWAMTPPEPMPKSAPPMRLASGILDRLGAFLEKQLAPPARGQAPQREEVPTGTNAGTGNNEFGHVVPVKPRRRFALKLALALLGWRARRHYREGSLGGVESIHFARWLTIDEGRRLLFLSYYYGNWEQYFDSFVRDAALGINFIWTHTIGYPPTFLLLFRGCRGENANSFKDWVLERQIGAAYYYSAYPGLSLKNINDNTRLHAGFAAASLTDKELENWLNLPV